VEKVVLGVRISFGRKKTLKNLGRTGVFNGVSNESKQKGLVFGKGHVYFLNLDLTACQIMGNTEIPMMPKTTVSKLSLTQGWFPRAYPKEVIDVTQRTAPAMQ
jgi:hypothetical protein